MSTMGNLIILLPPSVLFQVPFLSPYRGQDPTPLLLTVRFSEPRELPNEVLTWVKHTFFPSKLFLQSFSPPPIYNTFGMYAETVRTLPFLYFFPPSLKISSQFFDSPSLSVPFLSDLLKEDLRRTRNRQV